MLYQKRRCAHIDMITSTTVQLAVAGMAAFAAAWWIDDRPVEWTPRIFATLGWSVLVLSIGATLVLYMLLRRGDASRVASLLYLVPPLTAVMAWIGFGETLAPFTIAGMFLTATGVRAGRRVRSTRAAPRPTVAEFGTMTPCGAGGRPHGFPGTGKIPNRDGCGPGRRRRSVDDRLTGNVVDALARAARSRSRSRRCTYSSPVVSSSRIMCRKNTIPGSSTCGFPAHTMGQSIHVGGYIAPMV